MAGEAGSPAEAGARGHDHGVPAEVARLPQQLTRAEGRSATGSSPERAVDAHADDEPADGELASVEAAIAALESQREVLGEQVTATALEPLLARRRQLQAPGSEQRRLVTVLFADLVDFTVLSGALDPEDTREVVGRYFAQWQRVIESYGGVVEKFIGDAVMAVFGLERSYEDDAHRAVRAALAMLTDLAGLSNEAQRTHGIELHMRVGVDTGEVVVSTLGERHDSSFVAVGPTVNRAARLQAAAPVDRVLISGDTQRLLRGAFGVEEREKLQLKGIDDPVSAFVVTSERRNTFRLDASADVEGEATPTIGRELQLRFLQDRLEDVIEESRWRLVTVVGDAGIGKSRVLFEFDEWLAARPEPYFWFRGRAAPATQDTPLALLRDIITTRLDLPVGAPAERVREAFLAAFTAAVGPTEATSYALHNAAWLGFDIAQPGDHISTHPQTLRDLGTEAAAMMLAALGQRSPVVILLEDLHWADEGTLRWLDAAETYLAGSPVLVVATSRPTLLERRPRWGEGLPHHVRLDLAPLSRRESRELVGHILRKVVDLPPRLVTLVVDGAEGNPFYLEELTTWLVDAGVVVRGEDQWRVVEDLARSIAVPSTLKGVLQSRLDSLSHAERSLLQRASVVGRVFWDGLLATLGDGRSPRPAELTALLDGLRGRDLLLEREVSRIAGHREFVFKHALLRDVAYDGVLRSHRERYHGQVAEWLADVATRAGQDEEYAGVVATHLEQAHDDRAARWYLRAGDRAARMYALEESRELLGSARRLAPAEDPEFCFDVLLSRHSLEDRLGERQRQADDLEEMMALEPHLDAVRRIELLLARTRLAFVLSDYDEARARSGEAVQQAAAHGRDDLRAEAILWQGKALTWAEDPDAARSLLQRCVVLSRSVERSDLEGEALRYLAMVAGNIGDFPASYDHGVAARQVFARMGDRELESAAIVQLATTLYYMGRYAESEAALKDTLPIFRRAGHVYREAINLGNLASVGVILGRLAQSDRYARQAVEVSRSLDDQELISVNLLVLSHVDLFTGRWDDALRHAEEAREIAREVGNHPLEIDAEVRLTQVALVHGDGEGAIAVGRRATAAAGKVSSGLDAGLAHLTLGCALVRSTPDVLDEADAEFAEAGRRYAEVARVTGEREAQVGRARVALARGHVASAVALVEPVLRHLNREDMLGTSLPATMLRGCVEVLRAADDPRAREVLAAGCTLIRETAAQVDDEELRERYLAIAPNRALLQDPEAT